MTGHLNRALRRAVSGLVIALSLYIALPGSEAVAQSRVLFEPVAKVDGTLITRFELNQRLQLLDVLGSPFTSEAEVLEALIDDRLKMNAVRRFGADLEGDELQIAAEQFAARLGFDFPALEQGLAEEGIAPESLRDYIEAGAGWRKLVRGRYSRAARVSEEELDRAMALGSGGNVQVLVSEIVLPMNTQSARISAQRAEVISEMREFEKFEAAARQVSVSPSAQNGGKLEWLSLSQLPPAIGPIFLSMAPGDVTQPVPIAGGQAIALFQLRGLRDARPRIDRNMDLTYMQLTLPGTAAAEATRITPLVENCDSLFTLYPDSDDTTLRRIETSRAALSSTVARVFDGLDPGELAALPDGSALVMLCNRTAILGADLSRDDLSRRLFNRNLEDLAASFLAELRANAFIEFE